MVVGGQEPRRGVLIAVGISLFIALSSVLAEARTLVCESVDGQPRYCRSDTRGGVRLVRQYSKSGCYEGRTWGYDRRGIWVTDGCRAKFEVGEYSADPYRNWGYGGRGYGDREYDDDRDREHDDDYPYRDDRRRWRAPQTLTCESWGNRLNYCRARLGNARVELERQLSDTRCREGENWGWDGGGIWVRNGCRAVFAVY